MIKVPKNHVMPLKEHIKGQKWEVYYMEVISCLYFDIMIQHSQFNKGSENDFRNDVVWRCSGAPWLGQFPPKQHLLKEQLQMCGFAQTSGLTCNQV